MEDRPWWILIRCSWDSNRPRGQRWGCKLVLVMDAEGPAEPDLQAYIKMHPCEVLALTMWRPTAGVSELRMEGPPVLKERFCAASRREQEPFRAVVMETIRQIVVDPPDTEDVPAERRHDPSNN